MQAFPTNNAMTNEDKTIMRRKDKEITDKDEIDKIINQCHVCRLGLAKNNVPYIVPVSFGYDGTNIYFHTACEGRKIDYMDANNRVCIEFETDVTLKTNDNSPCKWGFLFRSAICHGTVKEIKESAKAIEALNCIMTHYSGKKWEITPDMLKSVRIWKVEIDSLTGKQSLP